MKKCCFAVILFGIFILFGLTTANAIDPFTLNGIWIDKDIYDWIINNPHERHLNTLTMLEGRFQISWDKDKNEGLFLFGMEPHKIKNIEILNEEVKMTYGYQDEEIIFKIISNSVIQVIKHPYYSKIDILYRVCDIEKPFIGTGKINENSVRLRNSPELRSGVFLLINKNEFVFIIGRSNKKQKIGELEDYWYEVSYGYDSKNRSKESIEGGLLFIDGWIFGAFLDIEKKDELERKLR